MWCIMRAVYVAQDKPATSEAVSTLSRCMRAPTDGGYQMLKMSVPTLLVIRSSVGGVCAP